MIRWVSGRYSNSQVSTAGIMLLEADVSSGLLTQVLLNQQRSCPPWTPAVVRTGRVGVGGCAPLTSSGYTVVLIQSWPPLCDPIDCSPPGSSVHGILQARILEWVAMPFSRGSSPPRDWTQVSHIAGGFFTFWATREAQEYWNRQPIPSPGELPSPGIELGSPALQVDSLPTEPPGRRWECC